MKNLLEAKGFTVLYLQDASLIEMEKAVRKFAYQLKNSAIGMFYYAGHGIEVDGQNYLIPTNADIPAKDEIKYEALAVNMLIDKMEVAHNRLNILVLDACRNDPFSRSGGGGLAPINNAKGMYVAYSTAPGDVASDGTGSNGLFTQHLMSEMNKPQTLEQVFKNTRYLVIQDSNEQQVPWTSSSITGDFFFTLPSDTLEIDLMPSSLNKKSTYNFDNVAPVSYALTITTTPNDARIEILNSDKQYHDQIKLKQGTYEIKVSKQGYISKRGQITLVSDIAIPVSLVKDMRNDIHQKQLETTTPKVSYNKSIRYTTNVNPKACVACHGENWEKHAMGKSKVVAEMTHTEIAKALKGYKAGTFGGPMKGVMKGQVSRYSYVDLEKFA